LGIPYGNPIYLYGESPGLSRSHPEMRCQDGKAKVSPMGIYEAKVGVVPPKLL
jgi:hypothetical protein